MRFKIFIQFNKMSIHTLMPTFRVPGFFEKENIQTISKITTQTIAQRYQGKRVIIPDDEILKFMQIVHEDRVESVAKMNERTVIDLVRSFYDFVGRNEQANYWSTNKWNAAMYDVSLGMKPYDDNVKLRGGKVGRDAIGGQVRFYFT